ncbi:MULTISPECIES: molybdopterin synthase [Haloferax]|uniref:Molybdopterin synthase n=2 Tax=Haloferax TaxID=2251 RepID=A0A6G1Z0E8_9EURY|nr:MULTISPECIES: molybdopterin synthase [Haloferax]KAB1187318.1 molybdopterin synthase [Haloferax sp. CBA1149]MRW79965.1 molybdopterin synthase [Haloferax marinisediminis]
MHVLGVVGPGATVLCERLAPHLDGRVATVESLPRNAAESDAPDSVDGAYGLAPEGNWVGAGENRDLDSLLDELSSRYDYALLSGFPDAHVPTLSLGDVEAANVVVEAEATNEVDLDKLAVDIDSFEPHITLGSLVEQVKSDPQAEYSGAIATFTGRVRAKDSEDDSPTTSLEFEKYDGVAEAKMATISEELEDREGVYRVLMYHRVGVIGDGEDIVFVVVLAGHRTEAFRTVEDGINRLKDEVPIFKKETTVDEEFWVHDR